MKVVISVGGSVIAPTLAQEKFLEYADVIRELAKEHTVLVVTGGGKAARDYIGVARSMGANEAVCDLIGISLSRLNARLLISALSTVAFQDIPQNYREAETAMSSHKVVVMGGVAPGQTTDAVSAILSEYVQADLLIVATSVDGVYTADPYINKDARRLDEVTTDELVKIVMSTEMKAGSKSVIDPLAAKIIERSKVSTVVIDGRDPHTLLGVIQGERVGTRIIH
ncbi:MAG: UMP kinase [Halobacteriota archaeon]